MRTRATVYDIGQLTQGIGGLVTPIGCQRYRLVPLGTGLFLHQLLGHRAFSGGPPPSQYDCTASPRPFGQAAHTVFLTSGGIAQR